MDNMIKNMRLPALFGGSELDRLFESLSDTQYTEYSVYPTDIVEISENETVTGYEIIMALAGISRENIDVNLEDDTLNISVTKQNKENETGKRYIKNGIARRSAKVQYALHGVDKNKITSVYENGVLTVKIPLAEESKPRKITIG